VSYLLDIVRDEIVKVLEKDVDLPQTFTVSISKDQFDEMVKEDLDSPNPELVLVNSNFVWLNVYGYKVFIKVDGSGEENAQLV
jgi:hypothetical protein